MTQMALALKDVNSQMEDLLTPVLSSIYAQWELLSLLDSASHTNLLVATTDTRDRARLRCLEKEGAADWLGAIHRSTLDLYLKASKFKFAVNLLAWYMGAWE